MWVQSLGREDPLEKEMATHSSISVWRATVPGLARVGHAWRANHHHWETAPPAVSEEVCIPRLGS